ncbi:hypothetical protein M2396_004054 [Pseudomonas sp. BIGb0278]|uniref:hypothetical protein n=1 Tax=Pseudomonas sp. BIGb0278 TaxID=2940607 RepID=UPI00216A19E3|nr:hypothetical protein [Pseudomonas sp. BIGb0278]MCS4285750.1 hypothetical protein [Pseudomonas sp. BIGb0278]
MFTVAGMIDRYHDKRIFLYPDHIYSKPWHRRSKSIFIESILLGMPTTEFWCEEDNFGAVSVLDGTQRVKCLLDFVNDKFRLEDLKLLPELEGRYYSELPFRHASTLSNRAELYFTTISYDTHPSLKFEFFKRINSDSYRFPIQAARNFAFREHFRFIRNLQDSCSEYLKPLSERSESLSKNDYLSSASFDELYLLLSALTLTFHGSMPDNEETSEDLLDKAAMLIHFEEIDTRVLERKIRSRLRSLSRSGENSISLDSQPRFSKPTAPRLDAQDSIRLSQNQIANLYIYSLKDEVNSISDFYDVLNSSPRISPRSASSYYRRLFR